MNFKYFNCSRLMTVVLGEGLEEIFGAGIFAIVCPWRMDESELLLYPMLS